MNSCIHSALRWLRQSGIQDSDTGGVHAAYRAANRSYEPLSVESTARTIQALLTLGDPQEAQQQEQARKAGQFLMEQAFDLTTDLFQTTIAEGGVSRRRAELSACGAALEALVALWQSSGDGVYLECASRCARAIQTRLSRVDGAFFPHYDLDNQTPEFGEDASVEQLKVAAAFWRLAEDAGLREFEYAAEQMLKWALARHEGVLPEWIAPEERANALERYALFLEGLLPAAALNGQASQALQAGLLKLENGVQILNGSSPPKALARLIRLRLYADNLGIIELDRNRGDHEVGELIGRQVQSHDPKLDGAFVVNPDAGDVALNVDPESTIVSAQALAMWEEVEDGGFREKWQQLI